MDIPPNKLLPQDMVVVYDHGSVDVPLDPPVAITMHASDAKQAIEIDPIRYWLDPHDPPATETVESPPTAEPTGWADEEAEDAEDDARAASHKPKSKGKR